MNLVFVLVVLGFMLSTAYIFVKISERYGLAKGFIALMLAADIYVVLLMLLGIDRPILVIKTRIGSITITILTLFLLIKIPMTIYSILKIEQLRKILG